jgi:hypothetical protein
MTVDSKAALPWRPIRGLLAYGRIRSKCKKCSDAEDKCECREEDASPPARPTWNGQLVIDIPRIDLGLGFGWSARGGIDEILEASCILITIRRRAGSAGYVFLQRPGPS